MTEQQCAGEEISSQTHLTEASTATRKLLTSACNCLSGHLLLYTVWVLVPVISRTQSTQEC